MPLTTDMATDAAPFQHQINTLVSHNVPFSATPLPHPHSDRLSRGAAAVDVDQVAPGGDEVLLRNATTVNCVVCTLYLCFSCVLVYWLIVERPLRLYPRAMKRQLARGDHARYPGRSSDKC